MIFEDTLRKPLMRLMSKLIPFLLVVFSLGVAVDSSAAAELSNAQISKEIAQEQNSAIIEAFLKAELREVNENVTKPLLPQHKSLIFFIKQVDRGPLKSLFFLEEQVKKLRDAQKNINHLPYSVAFFGDEKRKILELKPTTEKIISYGIPLMKRDFHKILVAAKTVADEKRKHPIELMSSQAYRDAVYRHAAPTAEDLSREMGKLSEGEEISMALGWVLEDVTVTRVWLAVNDNKLPDPDDYKVFRKKRSDFFQKKLQRIYGK